MKGVTTHTHNTLSIRISTNGFCFCSYTATEPDTLQYHTYDADSRKTIVANFEEAWAQCPFALHNGYEHVQAIITSNEFTTVPFEYDKKEEYETIYDSCFPNASATKKIIANRLPAQGITILFPIEKELHTCLAKIGTISYFCPTSIIMGFVTRQQFEERRFLLAYHQQETLYLQYYAQGKPYNINSFVSANIQDHVYYILSLWNEFKLSQTEDVLYTCGDSGIEEMTPLLSQFIANRKRINPSELFRPHLLSRIKDIPFDLQTLLLCE
ncbi:MAG: DUF3822 family protein [Bacteroidaceae bacterium]|nr:DUF3822 family protein [Bacteroidaceae bacterium]